jgi:hypothetical protein
MSIKVLLQRNLAMKRCYFQFKKDRPDLKRKEVILRVTNIFNVSHNKVQYLLLTKLL